MNNDKKRRKSLSESFETFKKFKETLVKGANSKVIVQAYVGAADREKVKAGMVSRSRRAN